MAWLPGACRCKGVECVLSIMSKLKFTIAECKNTDGAFAAFVANLPQRFAAEGHLLHDQRNTIKAFNLNGQPVVVKRFRRLSLFQRIVYSFFRQNKAVRAFNNASQLQRRGVSTPSAFAFAEVWGGGLLQQVYYVSAANYWQPLQAGFDVGADHGFSNSLAVAFAGFVAGLHKAGIVHRDLNSTNVLWQEGEGGQYCFALIDINRITFYPQGQVPPPGVCFENLTLFTGNMALFKVVAQAYAVAMGGNVEQMVPAMLAQKQRHDAAWQRRKRILGKLKQLFR